MKVKIVLHTMKELRFFLNKPLKKLAENLEKESGSQIELIPFIHKHLDGEILDEFLSECEDAQIVITDYWNHPIDENEIFGVDWNNPFKSMAEVVKKAEEKNPEATFFATMKRSKLSSVPTLVHINTSSVPIIFLFDEKVIKSIKKYSKAVKV